jgi:hypothetical protein
MPKIKESEFAEANILLGGFTKQSRPIAEAIMELAHVNKVPLDGYYTRIQAIHEKHNKAAELEIKQISEKRMIELKPVAIKKADLETAGVPRFMYPILSNLLKIEE